MDQSQRREHRSWVVVTQRQMQAHQAITLRRWLTEREKLGTPLSDDEIRHGVNRGILPSTLLM